MCSPLPRNDLKEFSNFLGIHVTEVGAFFLKYTVVTLPLPGSLQVYTTSKPPFPIKKERKKKPTYTASAQS